jgi:hypothetical protein
MKRWLDEFENDLSKIGVTGWRKITTDRDVWKFILKKAKVMHGPCSQWTRRRGPTV